MSSLAAVLRRSALLALVGLAAACAPKPEDEVRKASERLGAAVKARDVEAVVALLPAGEKVRCGDAAIDLATFHGDLRRPDSKLHAFFFDAPLWNARYRNMARPKSLAEAVSERATPAVTLLGPAAGCGAFGAEGAAVGMCFERHGSRWVVSADPICSL